MTWTLTKVAMATSSIGWAAGQGPGLHAVPDLILATTDGGRDFALRAVAADPIIAVAAPDARHAFFLEQTCMNGGGCSSRLQELQRGASAPQTLWYGKTDAAIAFSFPTAEDGYIAVAATVPSGPGFALYVTHDGGASFQALSLPCNSWNPSAPGAMDFSSASAGWLLCGGSTAPASPQGQQKSLYATTDGGDHWSLISQTPQEGTTGSLPEAGFADSLYYAGGGTGYLGLDGSGIYRTTDGGRAWQPVFAKAIPHDGWASSIGLLPDGFGWTLAGTEPLLRVTRDGGQTWQTLGTPVRPVPEANLWDLGNGLVFSRSFPAAYRWTTGAPELILSRDGGAHWAARITLSRFAQTIQVLSAQALVAGINQRASSYVEESGDLGARWTRVALPKGWEVQGLGYLRLGMGWVAAIGHHTSFGLFQCDQRQCVNLHAPFGARFAQQTGEQSGFATGEDAQGRAALFATQDGGLHWTERILPALLTSGGATAGGTVEWLYQPDDYPVAMSGPHPLYRAVAVLKSTDGGRSWQQITLPAGDQAVVALSFEDAAHGILVTSSPVTGTSTWVTDDGGKTFHLLG